MGIYPFNERFDQEEVLVDRYSSLEPGNLAENYRVESDEGRALAALLESFVQASMPELGILAGAPAKEADLLVVSTAAEHGWFQSTTVDSPPASRQGDVSPIDAAVTGYFDREEIGNESSEDDWSESPAVPLVRATAQSLAADEDLMLVEDDPGPEIRVHPAPKARHVRRQEFRQLFSSLRRG